ncbi:MAG: AAA family ATPase [Deltaproteobacteria bacterium]|nr:AAA family ATPase [Deltaproteobacteria bacterium]
MKFCVGCGQKFVIKCPKCGFSNSPSFKFCGECGYPLTNPPEASPVDYSTPQSYTPKHLAEKILITRSALEGERKLVTVMFADVAGFTSLSEKLEPEEVHQIMEGCIKILMDEIHKYEGTINQFTGDGVMALFGAPLAHEDHAQRACYAALAIEKDLVEYSEKVKKDYNQEFSMRIGLNSGPVVVGSIGDDLHMDYTAIGDSINLASRMEGLAQPGSVLLSRNTQRLVKDYFDLKPIGPLEVKGKEEPQEAFELIKAGGAATRLEASMARGLTRFVGRENSMASLMEAYEKVKNGAGQVVGMVGEAGVGKSRLLFEFRHRLPQDKFGYLEGHCIHYGGAMPYLPILDLLRSYFEIREGEREMVIRKRVKERIIELDEKFQGIISPIQDILSLKVEDEAYLKLEPKQRREKVFEALRDLFIRESQERPLVLVIEDLHWIDKTSEEFLDYLVGRLANVKVMLVLLYRPEYTHQWGNKSYFNRVGLDQLTLKSSAELVKAILEGGETAPELSNLILNRAAGNPLFMEELTHSLLENGSIQKAGDQYILSKKPSDIQVPDTIQGIIAARMDRLEENLKRIMQVASVIGREFAFRILQAISDLREDLKTELLNLQGLELIYEKSLFPELEYVFKHALTQEVAYNSLLSNRRKEIHKRIGRAIEELYVANLEEFYEVLAYHYSKGEDIEKAAKYLKLSGEKAVRDHSLWEALSFYKEAVDLLNRLPDTEENKRKLIEVINLIGSPWLMLGFPEASLPYFQQGEKLTRELGDFRGLADFVTLIGAHYSNMGNYSAALRYTEEGFEEAKKVQDVELLASFGVSLCNTYFASARFQEIINKMPEVILLIEKEGRESEFFSGINPYSFICSVIGVALAHLGRFEEGKIFLEKAFQDAEKLGDPFTSGLILLDYGLFYWVKGDWKSATECFEKSLRYSEEAKFFIGVVGSLIYDGDVKSHLGELETGRKQAEKGLKIFRDSGNEGYLSWFYYAMGSIHLNLEDIESARTSMEEALRLSRKNFELEFEGLALTGLGMVFSKKDLRDREKIEECFSKGLAILQDHGMRPWYARGLMHLGGHYLDTGQEEKALENLKEAEAMFLEMGMDYWLGRTREILGKL